jgi:uncharacterized membrane protein YgdD (TMEM256/DUF423 family)
MKIWLALTAINGFLAVASGAFGAHGLSQRISETQMSAFETGVQYHLVHALALGLVALLAGQNSVSGASSLSVAGWAFLAGIVLFSGSLYFLGVTGSRSLVLVTPIGGVFFLAGWLALLWTALRAAGT